MTARDAPRRIPRGKTTAHMSHPLSASPATSRATTYIFCDENELDKASESPSNSEDSQRIVLAVPAGPDGGGSIHTARPVRAGIMLGSDGKEVSESGGHWNSSSSSCFSSSGEAKDTGRGDVVRVVVHEVRLLPYNVCRSGYQLATDATK